MSAERSPWSVLGLEPGADVAAVNRAYRKLASTMHPDKGGDAAAFVELQNAKDAILSGRAHGDAALEFWQQRALPESRCGTRLSFASAYKGVDNLRFEAVRFYTCETCKGSGVDPARAPTMMSPAGAADPARLPRCGHCAHVRAQRGIPAQAWAQGCQGCDGSGTAVDAGAPYACACVRSGARGLVRRQERFDTRLPPGAGRGTTIELAPAETGKGRVVLLVQEAEEVGAHGMRRQGEHLFAPTALPLAAIEGATVCVPVPGRALNVTLPPLTEHLDILYVVPGRGFGGCLVLEPRFHVPAWQLAPPPSGPDPDGLPVTAEVITIEAARARLAPPTATQQAPVQCVQS